MVTEEIVSKPLKLDRKWRSQAVNISIVLTLDHRLLDAVFCINLDGDL